MGMKAEWVEDYRIDYSAQTGFPFYVMGYLPEWVDGVMTDYGAMYKYVQVTYDAEETSDVIVKTQGNVEYYKIALDDPIWHQYFLANGIPTELDGSYKVTAMVRASEPVTIRVNMGWSWSEGPMAADVSIDTDWQEVEWEYTGIGGYSCNLVAQPGSSTAIIEWQWLKVEHNAKPAKPSSWQECLTSDGQSVIVEGDVNGIPTYMGNAETPWPAWALEEIDGVNANWRGDRIGEICAWALTMGRNFDDQCPGSMFSDSYRARPYPADIEAEAGNESNHVFAVHVTQIEPCDPMDENSIEWSNEFWIQSPKAWSAGTPLKIHFRYKASQNIMTRTEFHKNPCEYLYYQAIGNINFTTEWQEFDQVISVPSSADGARAIEFKLCSNLREPADFYFDDLSWQVMKLDEGWFIASANNSTGIEYDYDNAVECVYDADEDAYVATVGEVGKEETWVNEVMISTVRGNDAAFKGATIKLNESFKEIEWLAYTTATLTKIKLPVAGVWQIEVAPEDGLVQFVKLEGEEEPDPIDIVTNSTEVVVHGQERNYTRDEAEALGVSIEEYEVGNAWDNQFWILANRPLKAGEETVIEFDYKASVESNTYTMCYKNVSEYLYWNGPGDVYFTTMWNHFKKSYTIPQEADGMQAIEFNLATIKEACDYQIKNVQWYLKDASLDEGKTYENLIDAEGSKNFYMKEGKDNIPFNYGSGETIDIVWTIMGSMGILGSYWDATDENNNMQLVGPGKYLLEKNNVFLTANELYEYKVVGNRGSIDPGASTVDNGWKSFSVDQSGQYNLQFYFYPNDGKLLECVVERVSSAVDLVLDIPSGTNISDEIAAALDGNGARNIEINLHEGGYYTYTNSIMASGSITLYGHGATIDASNSSEALIAMERKSDATDWTEVSLHIDGVTILGLNNSLVSNNSSRYYVYRSVVVDNCMVNVANNTSYPIFDFRAGSTVLDFSVTGSTFYAPADIRTREFYSSQSGQRPTEYNEYATQKFIFAGNTVYNIAKSRNFFAHRTASQSWMSFEIKNNLFVDCGKQGQVIRGFNGGQASGKPSWYVSGNAFNYDGEDTGEMEISNDTYGKIENTVFGVMNFNDSYNGDFNGVFTLPYDGIAPQILGDQRWTITYQNAQAPDFSNILYFGDAPEFMKSQTNELSVNLQNERQIMGCQFDLVLPAGIYLNDIYNVWRSERHSVSYNMLADGTIRVVVVSTDGVPFYDYNGQILNMVFNLDNGLSEGDYMLAMKNIEMTTTDYETLRPEDQYIMVHVKDLLMGDVDSNGQVNVTDVVMIIDNILGKSQWNFNAEAADVNYDTYINVTDVVMVIDHILGKVNLNRAAAADAEMGAISLSTDMTTISLTNPSAYTAFQMDVTLPMGVSLEDVLLTDRAAGSHSVVIRKMDDGSYRIIGVSMQNKAFKDNAGDLLKLQLAGNAQGAVAINNVLFVTPQGVQHELAGVNAFGDVTGIANVNGNKEVTGNVFDLQGRQMNNAQLKKGLYILNGKKQIVK